ncbi:hypothetical protein V1520DRAFT_143348 [Lipomyces starkeyi]|uniref:J domain-containing protein n=1 Tax=Lipomyces starkeyi NRRL Y-11557 TaxID=675824 RepID=A0A1E3Q2S2_LIPST|nr:hypothetical protein LIPSTDRAFT_4330 [Lipomyces starkeyi NRRL Y-11557]
MSDSRYSYDENAEVWPYFAMTLLSLVLLPSTWKATIRAMKPEKNYSPKFENGYKPENYDDVEKFRMKNRKSKIFSKANIFIALGWIILIVVAYFIHIQETPEDLKRFDPYEILGIPYSATDREIKSRYRKLSLKFHPDKIRNIFNTTREVMEAQFVEMTKAYKSLTDEDTRKNYLDYGHPDGPQPMKHGIALPKWLVEERGTPLVILGYSFLVGVALPFVVWNWWSGTKQYTKNGIHTITAANIFETFAKSSVENVTFDSLIRLLANSQEYKILIPGVGADAVYGYLLAYLSRDKVDNELKKLAIVSRSVAILDGMLDIASAFKNAALLRKIITLTQAFTQALPPESNELLQLPKIDKERVIHSRSTLKSLFSLNDKEQQKVLGIDRDDDLKVAQSVAFQIPSIEILDAFFKVPGETVVTPNSIAHLVIKFRVAYTGATLPPPDPKDLEEVDNSVTIKKPLSTNDIAPQLEPIYAPYLPIYLRPKWTVLLVNPRENKIVEPPSTVTRMYTDGSVSTYKIQLSAPMPDQIGQYRFLIEFRSNAYVGADAVRSVVLNIEPAPTVEEIEDDISDPEEDSIAGAMAQLRGGKTKKKTVDVPSEDDSEEEEESSSEEEDSDTDINTDTEDEES